jgi:hypothetical protein
MMLPTGLEKWGLWLLTIPAPLQLEVMLDDQGREVKPLESLRWAVDNGANFGLARIAQRAAVYADPAFACMRELQSDAVKAKFPKQPDGDDWLRFYRRHRDLWVKIGNETLGFNGGNAPIQAANFDRLSFFGLGHFQYPGVVALNSIEHAHDVLLACKIDRRSAVSTRNITNPLRVGLVARLPRVSNPANGKILPSDEASAV